MGKLFGTDGIRGKANTYPMTAEMALLAGRAIAYYISQGKKQRKKVLIGKDTRISCYMLEHALAAGLCSCGVDVLLTGPMPTPAISYMTSTMRAAAGIVISASHNLFDDNGIKVFSSDGFKLTDEVEEELEKLILTEKIKDFRPIGSEIGRIKRIDDAYGRYVTFLKHTFPKELDLMDFRVVLDCANGASYQVAPTVMEELGAEVFAYGTTPDGVNINKDCGALYPENLIKKVKEHKADIGIALDGDADRVVLVDEKGELVDGDKIMAIAAIDMIKQGVLNKNTVVATVMSNLGLEIALKKHGGKLVRTKVGDRYVVEEMKKHNYNLGGEQSGHLIFPDYLFTGDGMIGALRMLAIMKKEGQKLSKLASGINLLPQVMKSVEVKKRGDVNDYPKISKKIHAVEKKLGAKGRVVLRFSGTEPKIRIMLEGEDKKEIQNYLTELEEIILKNLT